MKRVFAMLLALSLLLCGCGSVDVPETTAGTTLPVTEPTEPPTEPVTVPTTVPTEPTEPPTEPTEPTEETLPLIYQHPITGEMLAEPVLNRPVAVVINNIAAAQPLYGIADADVLFEIVAEGGGSITRCLAIYSDVSKAGVIGSVRSARTYLIDLARAYNAPLIHCGGSDYALNELKASYYSSINQFYNGKYFYRDQERYNSGYAWEHTLFTTGELLQAALEANNIRTTVDEGKTYGMTFAEDISLNGETANRIDLRFFERGKATVMTYDPETGCYTGEQLWKNTEGEFNNSATLEDAGIGVHVSYRNVFILYTKTSSDGYRMFAQLTGEGTGYYACGGQIVPIKWHRKSLTDPFTYTLEDGTPLTVGVGKTYVGVIPAKSPVTYE